MKKSIIFMMIALLAISLFPSCDVETKNTGTLRICFGEDNSRTIAPTEIYTDILDHYNIHLTLPDGETYVAENIKDTEIVLKDLPLGDYELVVLGFKEGESQIKAKGVVKFHLYADDNSVSVPMNFLGNGKLELTVKFDKSKLSDKGNSTVDCEILTTDMAPTEYRPSSMAYDKDKNILVKYDSLPAGTYLVRFSLKCKDKILSTITEAVRIVTTKTTKGEVTLDIGSKVDSFGMNIIQIDDNAPLKVDIARSKVVTQGRTYEYSASVKGRPEYVHGSIIKYTWIVNGEKKHQGESIVVDRSEAIHGKVFLSVLIDAGIEGILGSESMVVDFDSTFAGGNPNFVKQ